MRQVHVRLIPSDAGIDGTSARRGFVARGMRGWVDPSGAWRLEAEVHHGRFRCASYETGIQLGRGRSGCIGVEWLTDLDFGSRLRHCNHASRLHVGRGAFPETTGDLRDASCVRVVVRCEGNC